MHEALLQLMQSIVDLPDHEANVIKESFKPMSLAKGDYFLKSGKVNKYVGFINSGLVRYFVYKNDEESTFEFTREGEFIADYQSFNNRTASIQNIQAIEDCELLVADYPNVQKLFSETANGNHIGRIIVEHRFEVMVNQLLAVYMQSHEERYKSFVDQYSELAQRIPQYLIASYVGVQPQSLSRIRRRFSEGIS